MTAIEPLDLSITEAADILGVTRQTLNNLVNGKKRYFARDGDPPRQAFSAVARKTWLRLQMAYDLAQARKHEGDIKVKRVVRQKLDQPHPVRQSPMGRSAPRRTPAIRFGRPNGLHSGAECDVVEFCDLVRMAAQVRVMPAGCPEAGANASIINSARKIRGGSPPRSASDARPRSR